MGVQEVEAPCDVEGYAVPEAVPQQAAVRVRLYGAVQVATCSNHNSICCASLSAQCTYGWQWRLLWQPGSSEWLMNVRILVAVRP